jgi:hypothetical protein
VCVAVHDSLYSICTLHRGNTIMLDRILAERPDIIFQLAFTLTVSSIFFWQVWVAWKAVTR